jgi:hypothetical protein
VTTAEHLIGKIGHLGPGFSELEVALVRYLTSRERYERLRVLGWPVAVADGSVGSVPGDVIAVDPTTGALTVSLPSASTDKVGAVVMVINVSGSANTVSVAPVDGDQINGSVAAQTFGAAWGWLKVICYAEGKWMVVT